jgi:hypothetical protein
LGTSFDVVKDWEVKSEKSSPFSAEIVPNVDDEAMSGRQAGRQWQMPATALKDDPSCHKDEKKQ